MSYDPSIPPKLDTAMIMISKVARRFANVNDIGLWDASMRAAANGKIDEAMAMTILSMGKDTSENNIDAVLRYASEVEYPIKEGKFNMFIHSGPKWDALIRDMFDFAEFTPQDLLWKQFKELPMALQAPKLAFYMLLPDVFGHPFSEIQGEVKSAGYFLKVFNPKQFLLDLPTTVLKAIVEVYLRGNKMPVMAIISGGYGFSTIRCEQVYKALQELNEEGISS